jgi:acyl carrier protein
VTVDVEQFRAELYPILAEFSGLPVARIAGGLRLNDDLHLDSLKRIELVACISDKFAFDPDVDTLMELRTVDDIVRLVEERLRDR